MRVVVVWWCESVWCVRYACLKAAVGFVSVEISVSQNFLAVRPLCAAAMAQRSPAASCGHREAAGPRPL